MPKLGLTMEEGTIVRWHAAEGERVAQGQALLEVETDKVTVEVEAPATGVMAAPLVGEGQKVPVGALIGRILAGRRDRCAPLRMTTARTRRNQEAGSRRWPGAWPNRRGVDLAAVAPSAPDGRVTAEDVRAHRCPQLRPRVASRIFSSPRARKQARERGVDWRALPGSGPRGRVIERDVLGCWRRRLRSRRRSALPITSPTSIPLPVKKRCGGRHRSAAQRIAAERMAASFGSAPHFYLDVEAQAEALLELRDRLLPAVERKAGVRLTITDLLIRIVGAALAEHPRANAFWADGRIGLHERVNLGLAVATTDSAQPGTNTGLVVPVLRDVDRKPLAQIASERTVLVARARAGQLSLDDLTGGTFTLTNLGMYRVDRFHAILNPPQSAILAVGRIAERPVAIAGQLAVRRTVVLTLSCDHRVLDGVLGALFLGRVAQLIEDPYELLV